MAFNSNFNADCVFGAASGHNERSFAVTLIVEHHMLSCEMSP